MFKVTYINDDTRKLVTHVVKRCVVTRVSTAGFAPAQVLELVMPDDRVILRYATEDSQVLIEAPDLGAALRGASYDAQTRRDFAWEIASQLAFPDERLAEELTRALAAGTVRS